MEEGALESLAQGLPRDLGEFVLQNNNEFRDECIRWDKEQEERKRLEESQKELAQQQALAGNSGHASTSLDPNNDVLVSLIIIRTAILNQKKLNILQGYTLNILNFTITGCPRKAYSR